MEAEERIRADLLAPQPQDQPHAHEKGDEHLCVGCALKRDFIAPEWSLNRALVEPE
jgi:hypothetical protein